MQFYKGLYNNIKDELSKYNRSKFTIFTVYIDEVIKIDNRLYEWKLEYKGISNKPLNRFTLVNYSKKQSTVYRYHFRSIDINIT
jgi:hypothetical protein